MLVDDILLNDDDNDSFYDSEVSDTSDDNVDDDDPRERRVLHRIQNYIELTVNFYEIESFENTFGLKDVMYQFAQTNFLINNEPLPNAIPHEKAFLMTLWYMANTESFRQISDRFDLIRSHDIHQKQEISEEFQQLQDILGVIGSIDGCHIRIRRPIENQREYINRKRYSSILLQGVVNSQRLFTDVHIGEPGSMHDARVLRRSLVYEP
ncbi:uncharacterized protein LOC122853852 [Aphidius gifuensis]|uniref:uncharacterized protein LOC122853852 n=1 Tax=Aphidius gifuensis TaxID=684658 RepID=UPI001CDC191D|nr:uncharacterized protein LOC122853852 [Aphidius gifuensis]